MNSNLTKFQVSVRLQKIDPMGIATLTVTTHESQTEAALLSQLSN